MRFIKNNYKNTFNIDNIEKAMELLDEFIATNDDIYPVIMEALSRQYPTLAEFDHDIGDEVATLTCPTCAGYTIISLDEYVGFNVEWCCNDCGQRLVDENCYNEEMAQESFLYEPNCCDCEWTYQGGECDNCEYE